MATLTGSPIEMMAHLFQEQALLNAELARKRRVLSKMYEKLAKTDQILDERQERQLSRKQKKKLQWTHAMTKRAAENLKQQAASLDGNLKNCNDLVVALAGSGGFNWPWPSCQYIGSQLTSPCAPMFSLQQVPQMWDQSMLSDPGSFSAHTSPVDSGFYDTTTGAVPFDVELDCLEQGEDHDHVGDLFANPQWAITRTQLVPRDGSLQSLPPRRISHKRCHSDGTGKVADYGLMASGLLRRGASVGPVSHERDNVTQGANSGL